MVFRYAARAELHESFMARGRAISAGRFAQVTLFCPPPTRNRRWVLTMREANGLGSGQTEHAKSR